MSQKNRIAMAMYPMAKVTLRHFPTMQPKIPCISLSQPKGKATAVRNRTIQWLPTTLVPPQGKHWQGLRFIMPYSNYGFQPSRWRNLGRQDNTHMSYNAYDQMIINPCVFNLHHHVSTCARKTLAQPHSCISAAKLKVKFYCN